MEDLSEYFSALGKRGGKAKTKAQTEARSQNIRRALGKRWKGKAKLSVADFYVSSAPSGESLVKASVMGERRFNGDPAVSIASAAKVAPQAATAPIQAVPAVVSTPVAIKRFRIPIFPCAAPERTHREPFPEHNP